jgi:hypothetical protein
VRLTLATLCDAATVREGLLHILGAGINRMALGDPRLISSALAVIVEAEHGEMATAHPMEIRVVHKASNTEVGRVVGAINAAEPGSTWDPDLPVQAVVAIPLNVIQVVQDGRYDIIISFDGNELGRLPFVVVSQPLAGVTPRNVAGIRPRSVAAKAQATRQTRS